MLELTDALRSVSRERETRAVILAARGPAFSAGHDLRELVDGDITAYRQVFEVCNDLMATHPGHPAASDRAGPSHGHCRGLPTGRHV